MSALAVPIATFKSWDDVLHAIPRSPDIVIAPNALPPRQIRGYVLMDVYDYVSDIQL